MVITDIDLDCHAVATARAAVASALGQLDFAIGAAESEEVRKELEAAREGLDALIHDHIDPAQYLVDCRAADEEHADFAREQRQSLNWHRKRVL